MSTGHSLCFAGHIKPMSLPVIHVPPTLPTVNARNRIALIGEAPGEREEAVRRPFVGPSGFQLSGWLKEAGIDRSACLIDNVFSFFPRCDLATLFVSAKSLKELDPGESVGHPRYRLPVRKNRFVPPALWPELERLEANLLRFKPNVIAAIGAFALWALTGKQGIEQYCGMPFIGHLGIKVVPVIHPAAILRSYGKRPLCIRAMKRLAVESEAPHIIVTPKERSVYLLESVFTVREAVDRVTRAGKLISFDIETHPPTGTVRSIAFGNDPLLSYCVVFCREPFGAGNYWDEDQEHEVVLQLRHMLESPVPKLAQNGAYDVAFLWLALGIRVMGYCEDTRLKHHALSPEESKDLATLGAKYLPDVGAWKTHWKSVREGKDK